MELESIQIGKIIQIIDNNIQEPYNKYDIFYKKNNKLYIDEKGNEVILDSKLIVKELDIDSKVKFQIFGSKSSTDYDIMIFVKNIPINEFDATSLCKGYNIILPICNPSIFVNKKPMNSNLAILGQNKLLEIYKGTLDECNNSLIDTYHLHTNYEQYVKDRFKRDIQIKALRTARVILSFLSRTEFRSIIKKALKSDLTEKLEVLKIIDLSKISYLGSRNIIFKDYVKTIAFQLGQTNSLMLNNTELYTKESIIKEYPFLKPHLMRDDNVDLNILELGKLTFIDLCENFNFDSLIEYNYKKLI